ncbi:hypothetical protein ACJMK2_015700, partial [Sinanodonta woodiana]
HGLRGQNGQYAHLVVMKVFKEGPEIVTRERTKTAVICQLMKFRDVIWVYAK